MSASDFFSSIGFKEWADEMGEVDNNAKVSPSVYTYNDESLLLGKCYGLRLKSIADAKNKITTITKGDTSKAMWISFDDRLDNPQGIDSVYAMDLDTVMNLVEKMQDHIDIVFISPASTLRNHNQTLAQCLEQLNLWVNGNDSPEVTFVLVDLDTNKETSDSRKHLHRYCEKILL